MSRLRTLATLGLLGAALPLNLAVTAAATVRALLDDTPAPPRTGTTVLVSGGKMTKALTLCRAFHRAGHRVVLVESARYRLTGHRFSRCVDAFHVVPEPTAPEYPEALLEVVRAEGVDVYVPVCSPVSSYHDARAKEVLRGHCEVLHEDPDTVAMLDDKDAFCAAAAELGLPVPAAHRVTDPAQVAPDDGRAYVLKSIAYDPVARLDLTTVPRPTPAQTRAFAASKPISADNPWVMQEFLTGREYCTHSTVRDGETTVWACCASSPFQVNYAMVDKPEIRAWVDRFVRALRLTGQVSFDVIEDDDGTVRAIECNPRTHSAITMFAGHPDLAAAYLDPGAEPGDEPGDEPGTSIEPLPDSRPTYWLYHEVWRLLTGRGDLRTILRGRDAIFDARDPLPFLLVHHLQIPWLLLGDLVRGREWVRIDFNIGKLVEPAGD